jgi:pimeloyl-ACP methyl ester carboxylesterase
MFFRFPKEIDSMKKQAWLLSALALGFVIAVAVSPAVAQSNPIFVPFTGGAKALFYLPDNNPSPRVAVLTVHRTGDKFTALECTELSRRGFGVLCLNTRFQNNEALVEFEKIPLDVKQGVEYLKKRGVSKVILLGHSGGGATTTFYQAVAEAGPAYCKGPNKITACDDSLAGLPRADGMLLLDAHPSNASNALRAMNPAVFNEQRPDLVEPSLDPFNPANGYNPEGQSHYPPEFVKRYSAAQAKRMNEWIDRALLMRKLMKEGSWIYPDNDVIVIGRGNDRSTNIFAMDTSIQCCTKRPQRLLKNDGSIVTQMIKSVRPPDTTRAKMNGTFGDGSFNLGGTRVLTVKSFLSANAIRATDSLDYSKIDWCSSNNSVPCALKTITVPVLIAAMQGHYFVTDSEYFLDIAKSTDKEFIAIEGAVHMFTPCTDCEGGPYNNSVKNLFDYVAKWINARFQ